MRWNGPQNTRLRRLFLEGFLAMDIAEPLVSFDAEADARAVHDFMAAKDYDLAGIRQDGLVNGYARREELSSGICKDHLRPFSPSDDLVPDTANLLDEDIRAALGQESRGQARKAIKELEALRNNLAHTQVIVPDSWQQIVITCSRLEQNLSVLTDRLHLLTQPRESEESCREDRDSEESVQSQTT